jgi:hypothetical protein
MSPADSQPTSIAMKVISAISIAISEMTNLAQ